MTATIPGALVDDWLEHAPIAALECRTLRHLWPRMPRPGKNGKRGLPSEGRTAWKIVGNGEAGRVVERRMECLGDCGTARIETFLVLRDGRMVRDGVPRYHYERLYLRKRADYGEPALEPLGQDQIMGMLVRRMYPRLKW